MKERIPFASGFDHTVYKQRFTDTHDHANAKWIFKVPHGLNLLLTLYDKESRINQLKNELERMQKLEAVSGIKVPHTRIFPTSNAYIIAQEFIPKDPEADIDAALDKIPHEYLHHYDDNPANFILHNGELYSIDPFNSLFSRISGKITPLFHYPYRKSIKWLRAIKRKLMLTIIKRTKIL